MARKKPQDVIPSNEGVFKELSNSVKLIMRLMADPRVNSMLKLLPIGSLLYLLIPDIAPGPIDDAIVVWLGSTLFIELCPPDVVDEHRNKIKSVIDTTWHNPDEGDVIDTEFKDLE